MKFTINENRHYSIPWFILPHINVTEASFYNIKFDKNCWYEITDVEYTGVNKLCGLGYGFDHHKNSIRVGWQPDFEDNSKKSILLYSYWYDQATEGYQKEYMCCVDTNEKFDVNIYINEDNYTVKISDYESIVKKTHNKKWGFWLKPYFGGNSVAPCKMKIWLEKKSK